MKEKNNSESFFNSIEIKVLKLVEENSNLNLKLKKKEIELGDFAELEKNIKILLDENLKLSNLLKHQS